MNAPVGDTFATLSMESKVVLFSLAFVWVYLVITAVLSWTKSAARWIYDLLGFGLDEEEMLGIKHHKKGGNRSKSTSKSKS